MLDSKVLLHGHRQVVLQRIDLVIESVYFMFN